MTALLYETAVNYWIPPSVDKTLHSVHTSYLVGSARIWVTTHCTGSSPDC